MPVSMDAGSVPVNRYILSLGCDLRLELPGLPSPQWLAQVSQALQGQAR
ncbi:hypothetical protein [Castellaniella defragrans]|nr:hypothetical protein [Castellaniella defragrans]